MVAKISVGNSLYGAIAYNGEKINEAQGRLLTTNRIYNDGSGKVDINKAMEGFLTFMPPQMKVEKPVVHISLNPHPEDVLAYWRVRHAPFDVGYGVHVLTDAQWVPRFRARVPEILLPDGKIDTGIYYNDTFVTDFQLYRDCGGRQLFDWVEQGRAPEDHPLLTHYELEEWKKMMVNSYRGECPKHDPVRYIGREYVESFIDDCQELFEQVYRRFEHE